MPSTKSLTTDHTSTIIEYNTIRFRIRKEKSWQVSTRDGTSFVTPSRARRENSFFFFRARETINSMITTTVSIFFFSYYFVFCRFSLFFFLSFLKKAPASAASPLSISSRTCISFWVFSQSSADVCFVPFRIDRSFRPDARPQHTPLGRQTLRSDCFDQSPQVLDCVTDMGGVGGRKDKPIGFRAGHTSERDTLFRNH